MKRQGYQPMSKLSVQARGGLAMVGVCVIWIFLASRRPELTYHFAPLIAAGVWPFLLPPSNEEQSSPIVRAAVVSAAAVSAVAVLLHIAGRLEGPTFWDDGPALTEAILFAVGCAAIGAAISLSRRDA